MAKLINLFLIVASLFFLISPISTFAQEKFIAPIFPIRGIDNWQGQNSPAAQTIKLINILNSEETRATWLVRYDAMSDKEISSLIKSRLPQDEVGVFMEITKSLADASGVNYSDKEPWYDANKVFLSGYSINERETLIDKTMNQFLSIYGAFPRTVGVWHLDAYSAKYLQDKYGVTGIILCADQYSTDKYQLWGSFWGVPYIPSKKNLLVPAPNVDSRIPLVIGQWAARDALNGYGLNIEQSTYSVQANDYMLHGLSIDYFKQLASSYLDNQANEFGFLIIGIENDYNLNIYGQEVKNQLNYGKTRAQSSDLKTVTFNEFSNWYLNKFSTSPAHQISIIDPLKTLKVAQWRMDLTKRVGYVISDGKSQLRDLRYYDASFSEPFLANRNLLPNLYHTIPAQIDTAVGVEHQQPVSEWKSLWPGFNWWEYLILFIGCLVILLITFKKFILSLVILLCSVLWILPMIRSGQLMPYGLGFWGPNGHDAIWHIAISEHFSRGLSLNNPILSGANLQNYHFFFDFVLGYLSKITNLSILTIYFHLIPIILSLTIAVLIWFTTKDITKSKRAPLFAIITVFISGSAGWIFTLIKDKSLGGETMFWAQQSISTLINPPFALSLVILLFTLLLISKYFHTPTLTKLIITSLFIAILAQTKIYASILLLSSLAILSAQELINTYQQLPSNIKKISHNNFFSLTKLFITGSILSGLFFLPFVRMSNNTGFPFIWKPFWFVTTMVQDQDHFFWPRMANALSAYQATQSYPKLIMAITLTILIFLIGNFWTRIIGVVSLTRNLPKTEILPKLMFYIFAIGIIFPMLFIQRGTAWNTIQFMYYSLFISSIWTAIAIASFKHKFFSYLCILILVALNLPTSYGTLKQYLPSRAPSRIPNEELQALRFLKNQEPGRVLAYPYPKESFKNFDEPKPLRAYESTAYISAISGQPTVFADQVNLEILGLDWPTKRNEIISFYYTNSFTKAQKFITDNQISYIYQNAQEPLPLKLYDLDGKLIFDNGLVKIFHIPSPKVQ